jgi:hypothetical protein
VRETQAAVLREILRANATTEFGRQHGFAELRDVREFQERVPLRSYADHSPWIERLAAGENGLLTAEPVRLFEPTSGSTSGEKLIPYTASLRAQFQRAIAAWTWNTMALYPKIRDGRAYWSVSPAGIPHRTTSGGHTIGFASDAEYLGGCQQRLVSRMLVTPPAIAQLDDIDAFRYATLAYQLAAADLSLISVWSPTFLTSLLAPIEECWPQVCRDLATGELSVKLSSNDRLPWRKDAARARHLERIFGQPISLSERLAQCWPKLSLVSCWADAAAGIYAEQVRAMFPDVPLQPKGLLATEGVVSIPRGQRAGAALATRSHFFEFEEVAANAPDNGTTSVCLADELCPDATYRVVLTTGGGLYRYRLGDEVRVVGFEGQCPLVRFVGRADCIDLVGEKLTASQAEQATAHAFERVGLSPSFSLLAPEHNSTPRYNLFIECQPLSPEQSDRLRAIVESELSANVYYKQALALKQLQPLKVAQLNGPPGSAWTIFEGRYLARGLKPGAIKPRLLDSSEDWTAHFVDLLLERPSES